MIVNKLGLNSNILHCLIVNKSIPADHMPACYIALALFKSQICKQTWEKETRAFFPCLK